MSDTGELYPTNSGGPTVAASFQAIDDAGNPVHIAGSGHERHAEWRGRPGTALQPVDAAGAGHRRPAVRRHRPDPRRRRHRQRPHQPVHHAGHRCPPRQLQPLQLAADHGGPLRRVQLRGNVDRLSSPSRPDDGLRRPRRARATSGTPPRPASTPFGSDVFTAPSGNGFLPPSPPTPGKGSPRRRWRSPSRLLASCSWAGTWCCVAVGTGPPSDDHRRRSDGATLRRTGPSGPVLRASGASCSGVVLVVLAGHAGLGHQRSDVDAGPTICPIRSRGSPSNSSTIRSTRPASARWPIRPSPSRVTSSRSRRRRFSALAVVNGPVVPGEGLPVQQGSPPARGRSRSPTCTARFPLAWPTSTPSTTPRRSTSPTWCPDSRPLPADPAHRPEPQLQDPRRHAGRRRAHAVGARRRPHRGQVGLPGRERLSRRSCPGAAARRGRPVGRPRRRSSASWCGHAGG